MSFIAFLGEQSEEFFIQCDKYPLLVRLASRAWRKSSIKENSCQIFQDIRHCCLRLWNRFTGNIQWSYDRRSGLNGATNPTLTLSGKLVVGRDTDLLYPWTASSYSEKEVVYGFVYYLHSSNRDYPLLLFGLCMSH